MTAVYASNDTMAYGCICLLVPHAELTSARFDNRQVGLWAVEKLVGEDDAAREHVLFPGELVERSSVRAL